MIVQTLSARANEHKAHLTLFMYDASKMNAFVRRKGIELGGYPALKKSLTRRWEHLAVLEEMQLRLSKGSEILSIRKRSVQGFLDGLGHHIRHRVPTAKLALVGERFAVSITCTYWAPAKSTGRPEKQFSGQDTCNDAQ